MKVSFIQLLNDTLTPINAENLRKAHALLEGGRTIGKIVLEKFMKSPIPK